MKDTAGIVYCADIEMCTIEIFYLTICFGPQNICISTISISIFDKIIINYLKDIIYAYQIKEISTWCTQHIIDFTLRF